MHVCVSVSECDFVIQCKIHYPVKQNHVKIRDQQPSLRCITCLYAYAICFSPSLNFSLCTFQGMRLTQQVATGMGVILAECQCSCKQVLRTVPCGPCGGKMQVYPDVESQGKSFSEFSKRSIEK